MKLFFERQSCHTHYGYHCQCSSCANEVSSAGAWVLFLGGWSGLYSADLHELSFYSHAAFWHTEGVGTVFVLGYFALVAVFIDNDYVEALMNTTAADLQAVTTES